MLHQNRIRVIRQPISPTNVESFFSLSRLTELLHQLLVLVELLESLNIHGGVSGSLSLVNMLLVTEDADAQVGAGHVLQSRMNQTRGTRGAERQCQMFSIKECRGDHRTTPIEHYNTQ